MAMIPIAALTLLWLVEQAGFEPVSRALTLIVLNELGIWIGPGYFPLLELTLLGLVFAAAATGRLRFELVPLVGLVLQFFLVALSILIFAFSISVFVAAFNLVVVVADVVALVQIRRLQKQARRD